MKIGVTGKIAVSFFIIVKLPKEEEIGRFNKRRCSLSSNFHSRWDIILDLTKNLTDFLERKEGIRRLPSL